METDSSDIPAMRHASISALGLYLLSGLLVFTIGAFAQIRVDLAGGLFITEVFLIALPAIVFIQRNRWLIAEATFARPRLSQVARSIIVGSTAAVAAVAAGALVRLMIGSVVDPTNLDQTMLPASIAALMLALWILAPLCEELLFRVAIQGSFSTTFSPQVTVLASSALFAVFHGAIERLPETFLLGCFLGLIYQRTGSYWLAVAFHAAANILGPPLYLVATEVDWVVLLIIGMAMLAVAFATLPRSAEAWMGPVRRYSDGLATASRRAPALALAVVLLLGIGAETAMHLAFVRSGSDTATFPASGWCVQEWRLGANSRFTVRERVTLPVDVTPPERIRPIAPTSDLQAASLDAVPITYNKIGDHWELDPSSATGRHLLLIWSVPLASLDQVGAVYWLDTRSPVPVNGFRVDLVLELACGFEDPRKPASRQDTPITMNTLQGKTLDSYPRVGFTLRRIALEGSSGSTSRSGSGSKTDKSAPASNATLGFQSLHATKQDGD